MRTYSDNAAVLLTRGRVEDAQANLTSISALTGRIAQITQHLKGFARKASSGLGPVSVQAAINAAVILLEHRLRQQGIRVSRDVPEAEVRVWAEQVRLEQVLVNLVQNAMDALAGAANREIFIAVRTAPASDRVVVTVADNGPGVPADTLPKIFSAFFTTKGNGLGLGLSISQGIVRDFGGTLTCTARPGGGAAFEVELRMAP
jgi:two-component system C4-dicarboxylate transport sensor histidine kinase DctB